MKLIRHDNTEILLSLNTRVTGLLKDSVARELMNLKDDPKDLRQKELLAKITAAVDPKAPEKTKVNLADGLELNMIAKKPYQTLEYNVIRENDATTIRAFKYLVDTTKLSPEDLDLFNTSELDAFWQNQDINEIREQLEFFRKKATI